jgi:hypothetical protein
MSDQCVQPWHIVLVQEPGCISLFDLKERMHETRFPEGMVKAILTELLQAEFVEYSLFLDDHLTYGLQYVRRMGAHGGIPSCGYSGRQAYCAGPRTRVYQPIRPQRKNARDQIPRGDGQQYACRPGQ